MKKIKKSNENNEIRELLKGLEERFINSEMSFKEFLFIVFLEGRSFQLSKFEKELRNEIRD